MVLKKSKTDEDEILGKKMSGKKVSDAEKAYIDVIIEKSKLNRSIAELAFKKSIWMYFVFLVFSVVGLILELIVVKFFFILIIMGLGVLVVGSVPYVFTMLSERKRLNIVLFNLMLKDENLKSYNHEQYIVLKKGSEKNAR